MRRLFKKLGVKTYEPKKRVELRKEQTLPFLSYFSSKLMYMGGLISFFVSLFFGTIKGFFFAKEKIKAIEMKNAKVLDLRKK